MYLTHKTIKLGQRVVIATEHLGFFSPLQHNHGSCSGKVLKVGRKYAHIESNGAPWKVYITDEAPAMAWRAYDMATARQEYAQTISHLHGDAFEQAMATL